jgi:iron-sulfur cluster repair protein YtfE (RIC family)
MKITDAFLGEHAIFYAQFDHLEQAAPAAETLTHAQGRAALLGAALETHAQLEEELLFAILESHVGPAGPLVVMRAEHAEIEGTLVRLPEVRDLAEVQRLVLHVVRVAREHFAKEEQILYPLAQRVLDADTMIRQGKLWAERRRVSIG